MVTIGSLCSGYGGLDMGLQSVIGGEVLWHFEYEKAPSKILEHRYPGIPNYGDITKTDWDIQSVDWITAGYPCQPFSTAGHRKGTNDKRHIWPYIREGIRQLRPRGVLLENVAGHLTLGFDSVLGDLASIGYDAKWICLRAADAGAPHGRKRLFIVAYPNSDARSESRRSDRDIYGQASPEQHRPNREKPRGGHKTAADTSGERRTESDFGERQQGFPNDEHSPYGIYRQAIERWERILGRSAPRLVDDAGRLDAPFVEWMMGLPEGWVDNVEISRSAKLTALGNGVVPQQAALALRMMGVEA